MSWASVVEDVEGGSSGVADGLYIEMFVDDVERCLRAC